MPDPNTSPVEAVLTAALTNAGIDPEHAPSDVGPVDVERDRLGATVDLSDVEGGQ